MPVVIAGVIGARVYHLFTGYKWSEGGIAGAFEIWKGGLSIWGAVGGGLLAVMFLARRRHLDTLALLDAIGPGVVVAQAIGRWGNYFNQELFGRPSKLPWALEIDPAHRPAALRALRDVPAHVSLRVDLVPARVRRRSCGSSGTAGLREGSGVRALRRDVHASVACFFEWMRVDPASRIFGIRFNLLLSAVLCVIATVSFVRLGRNAPQPVGRAAQRAVRRRSPTPRPPPSDRPGEPRYDLGVRPDGDRVPRHNVPCDR